jgi:hypothetical protein
MKTLVAIVVLAARVFAGDWKPEVPGPEGERAFRELTEFYADEKKIPHFAEAFVALGAAEQETRSAAGRFLMALFAQSFADERNGRARWAAMPYWGGGSRSDAREFRKYLAEEFGKNAKGDGAFPAVRWLAETERMLEGNVAAAAVLPRIESPEMEKLLGDLLVQPHPNESLAKAAVTEAGRRKLRALLPRINELCFHYRTSVREAARKALVEVSGPHEIKPFNPADGFSPWLSARLSEIAQLVPEKIPSDAMWAQFDVDVSKLPVPDSWRTPDKVRGWALGEEGKNLRVISWFGEVHVFPKTAVKRRPLKLADEVQRMNDARKSEDGHHALSSSGGLTGQFESGTISVPEALLGAWLFERGEMEKAAALLFPRIEAMQDDRWLAWISRDLLGHLYHQQMLQDFSGRDYGRALARAEHLSKAVFDEYEYQSRAKELAAQLKKRGEDFKTFKLPSADEWKKLAAGMSREEQARWLAERLRLLNCLQLGQPSDVNYHDPQFSTVDKRDDEAKTGDVINPFNELLALKLTVAELPSIVPALADTNFMPTFSYWRNFHPSRTLHRVNWVVARVINRTAKRDLALEDSLDELDDAGRQKLIASSLEWCKANLGKSGADLLLDTLRTTKDRRDFRYAGREAVARKVPGTAAALIARSGDFPELEDDIALLVERADAPESEEIARRWVKSEDESVRFYGALILLRHGDRAKNEGFEEVKTQFLRDSGHYYDSHALRALLTRKDEASLALALKIFEKDNLGYSIGDELHPLALTGHEDVLKYLLRNLDDETADTHTTDGKWKGKDVERKLVRGDHVAKWLSVWRKDGWRFDEMAPLAERKAGRQKMKAWLKEQFALMRQGKPSAIVPDPGPVHHGDQWFIDAP